MHGTGIKRLVEECQENTTATFHMLPCAARAEKRCGVCAWQGTNVKGGKNAVEVEAAGKTAKDKDMPSKASRICRGFKRMYAHPADVDPAKRRPPQAQVTILLFISKHA